MKLKVISMIAIVATLMSACCNKPKTYSSIDEYPEYKGTDLGVTYSPKKDTMKDVVYFLARAKNFDHVPQPTEISQVKWVELSLIHSALTYDNDKQLINKAKNVIKESL